MATISNGDTSVDIHASLTGLTPTEPTNGVGGVDGSFRSGDLHVRQWIGQEVGIRLNDGLISAARSSAQ